MRTSKETGIFDDLPERYDQWFLTPMGKQIQRYEAELIRELSGSTQGRSILDAGCGTGVFTRGFLDDASFVTGMDISGPMLMHALQKPGMKRLHPVRGDMLSLPFRSASFDMVVSITAIEFIQDAALVMDEFFRVTRQGGRIVVATLNRKSPWAADRQDRKGTVFEHAVFRGPEELIALRPDPVSIRTVVHFMNDEDPAGIPEIEQAGSGSDTGAFIAGLWKK